MNINVFNNNGRPYLRIQKSYRNEFGKPAKKTVKSLGYLDALEKEYPDPIAHFREVARQMTEEEKAQRRVHFTIDMNEELPEGTANTNIRIYS